MGGEGSVAENAVVFVFFGVFFALHPLCLFLSGHFVFVSSFLFICFFLLNVVKKKKKTI